MGGLIGNAPQLQPPFAATGLPGVPAPWVPPMRSAWQGPGAKGPASVDVAYQAGGGPSQLRSFGALPQPLPLPTAPLPAPPPQPTLQGEWMHLRREVDQVLRESKEVDEHLAVCHLCGSALDGNPLSDNREPANRRLARSLEVIWSRAWQFAQQRGHWCQELRRLEMEEEQLKNLLRHLSEEYPSKVESRVLSMQADHAAKLGRLEAEIDVRRKALPTEYCPPRRVRDTADPTMRPPGDATKMHASHMHSEPAHANSAMHNPLSCPPLTPDGSTTAAGGTATDAGSPMPHIGSMSHLRYDGEWDIPTAASAEATSMAQMHVPLDPMAAYVAQPVEMNGDLSQTAPTPAGTVRAGPARSSAVVSRATSPQNATKKPRATVSSPNPASRRSSTSASPMRQRASSSGTTATASSASIGRRGAAAKISSPPEEPEEQSSEVPPSALSAAAAAAVGPEQAAAAAAAAAEAVARDPSEPPGELFSRVRSVLARVVGKEAAAGLNAPPLAPTSASRVAVSSAKRGVANATDRLTHPPPVDTLDAVATGREEGGAAEATNESEPTTIAAAAEEPVPLVDREVEARERDRKKDVELPSESTFSAYSPEAVTAYGGGDSTPSASLQEAAEVPEEMAAAAEPATVPVAEMDRNPGSGRAASVDRRQNTTEKTRGGARSKIVTVASEASRQTPAALDAKSGSVRKVGASSSLRSSTPQSGSRQSSARQSSQTRRQPSESQDMLVPKISDPYAEERSRRSASPLSRQVNAELRRMSAEERRKAERSAREERVLNRQSVPSTFSADEIRSFLKPPRSQSPDRRAPPALRQKKWK
eukprot:gnl/TRDRNA2_/TRDRNA2_81034_c0_seq1.p1 gnl/TRDRNA2_/TRDRNA2_81034_c0~~gnl/TRDRNA2_/TRDRNA2_81034_c0_seq1.p1  ORF type:complete len:871 (-),score=161.02 gnl/TRDRNA2_/TRDRNA2_81034_c0_seq1:80-2539(-)